MLRQVRAVVPRRVLVLVLADRGVDARGLFQRLVRLGGQPLRRIHTGGTFRPVQSVPYQPLRELVPEPGPQWVGMGTALQGPRRRRQWTLLARWDEGDRDPWLLLTDLAPSAGDACWDGLRAGIEQGCKLIKRGGWQWQADPQERSATRHAVGASRGGRHVVVAQRRGQGRGHPTGEYAAPAGRCRLPPFSSAPGNTPAVGQYLAPGRDHPLGGAAQSASPPAGPLRTGAMATKPGQSLTERKF